MQRREKLRKKRGSWLMLGAALAGIGPAGCTRHFFRERADQEVADVLHEKDVYPAWKIANFNVYPNPLARYADPTDPDRPPMPPDDPAAHDLGPTPQKPPKAGIAYVEGKGYIALLEQWDAANRAEIEQDRPEVGEPPDPRAFGASGADPGSSDADKLPGASADLSGRPGAAGPKDKNGAATPAPDGEKDKAAGAAGGDKAAAGPAGAPGAPGACPPRAKPFIIKLEQAVEMAVLNSRDFQDRREDLFLTALPVTLERFAFAPQFFAASEVIRQRAGLQTGDRPTNGWSFAGNVGVGKLFSTGALLLFDFANRTVVDFANAPRVISQSTINFDAIQPLLRGGGRAVVLENLTQAERNLLYEIRSYARFRKEFFVSIAGGGGGSITGGAFVPAGVLGTDAFVPGTGVGSAGGSSGIAPGIILPVPFSGEQVPSVLPGSAGRANLTKELPAPVSGFLGTLLQYAQIGIDRENIRNLERFLKIFQAFREGGDVQQLQVDQVEQQLLTGRATLLLDETQYGSSIDQFRLQLGVAPDLPIVLDDTEMRPLTRQFRRYEDIFRQADELSTAVAGLGRPDLAPQVRAGLRRLATEAPLVRGTRFARDFPARWDSWQRTMSDALRDRLRTLNAERLRLLDRQTDLERAGKPFPPGDLRRLNELESEIALGSLELALRAYEEQPWKGETNEALRGQRQTAYYRNVANLFLFVLAEARNERLDALRETWPDLPPICVDGVDLLAADLDDAYEAASRAAVANRFDLMNFRGQLVDAWRQLAVFSNALLGTFNVEYHLDSTTPAGQSRPFSFAGSRTRHQLIFDGQLPLVRVAERNNYRAVLIAYQRQRRALQEAEDLAKFSVRGEIRQLRQIAETFRLQTRQVQLAYQVVEGALDSFSQPPAPGGVASASQAASNAAALTQQLLQAQTRLPLAQNQLLTAYITYLNTRFQIFRDMELMPLDPRGVWIDDVATCRCPPRPGDRNADAARPGGERQRENAERLPPPGAAPAEGAPQKPAP